MKKNNNNEDVFCKSFEEGAKRWFEWYRELNEKNLLKFLGCDNDDNDKKIKLEDISEDHFFNA